METQTYWKSLNNQSVIEKFLTDYKLDLKNAAALICNAKSTKPFLELKSNPEKASLKELLLLGKYLNMEIQDLFEVKALEQEDNRTTLDSKTQKIRSVIFDAVRKSQLLDKNLSAHFYDFFYLPIISFVGDEFSGKKDILASYEKQYACGQTPCIITYDDDFTRELLTDVFRKFHFEGNSIKIANENMPFNPRHLFDRSYLEKWKEVERQNDEMDEYSVTILLSKNDIFRNFILLDLPEYTYLNDERSIGQIESRHVVNLIKYQQFANYTFFFEAISRFLTIHDAPMVYLLKGNSFHCEKQNTVKYIATRLELDRELALKENFDRLRQKSEDNKKEEKGKPFNSYLGPYSIFRIDNASISFEDIVFLNKHNALTDEVINFCNDYYKQIYSNDFGYEVEDIVYNFFDVPVSEEAEEEYQCKKNEIQKDREEIIREFYNGKAIKKCLDKDKFSREDFVNFTMDVLNEVVRVNYTPYKKTNSEFYSSFHFYVANLLFPRIFKLGNFSKGDADSWTKKILSILSAENVAGTERKMPIEIYNLLCSIEE